MDCAGTGLNGGYGHCARCNGKGCVCPSCCGMRFVKLRRRGMAAWESEVVRCPVCTEGNNVNEMSEIRAIRAYIARADALPQPLIEDGQEEGQS